MPNFSVQELNDVLSKSNLPFGDSAQMQQAQPFARQQLGQQVMGQDTQLPQISQDYKTKLDAIAQMDKKLSGVYGDPTSQLYIENPMAREQAIYAPRSTGQRELSRIDSMFQGRQKELDQTVNEAFNVYKQLTTLQSREEARAKKLAKGGKKKTTSSKVTDSLQRSQELQRQRLQLAGIASDTGINEDAADIFLNAPTKFQEQLIRDFQIIQGSSEVPIMLSPDEVQQALESWKTEFRPSKAKPKESKLDKLRKLFE